MQVVAIANDITYNSGAFGPKEDAAFRAATEYALQHRIPVMYLAANSGARVGLANEVKRCLKVDWVNAAEPQKGFKYLYLSDEDYQSITGSHYQNMCCNWGGQCHHKLQTMWCMITGQFSTTRTVIATRILGVSISCRRYCA